MSILGDRESRKRKEDFLRQMNTDLRRYRSENSNQLIRVSFVLICGEEFFDEAN